MRAVNLLPASSESRKSFRKEDPAVVIGSALGVVVLIALAVGFMNVALEGEHGAGEADDGALAARAALAEAGSRPTPAKPVVQISRSSRRPR